MTKTHKWFLTSLLLASSGIGYAQQMTPITIDNTSSMDLFCSGLIFNDEVTSKINIASGKNMHSEIISGKDIEQPLKCWPQYLTYPLSILSDDGALMFVVGEFARTDYYTVSVDCTSVTEKEIKNLKLQKSINNRNLKCDADAPITIHFMDTEYKNTPSN